MKYVGHAYINVSDTKYEVEFHFISIGFYLIFIGENKLCTPFFEFYISLLIISLNKNTYTQIHIPLE